MSSHHIVREGQEPALMIADPIPFSVAAPLLEWAPYVLVMEPAMEHVLSWGIKIDAVLMSRTAGLDNDDALTFQQPLERLTGSGTREWISRGLEFLAARSQEMVTLLCQNPQQWMDEFPPTLAVNILSDRQKWSLVRSGTFEQWLPSAERVWLRPGAPVHTSGLIQQADHYIVRESGLIKVWSMAPFWLGQGLF